MRCTRCGNENMDGNRFCGMCGATLLSAPPAAPQSAAPPVSAAPSSGPSTAPAPSRTSAPVSEDSPGISGPSFLGLNDPPRKRASLSIDPHASSGNVDYLLEDDGEPHHGGAGKFVLILLALALAAGFGYLRWKNQKFGWLGTNTNKPSAAAQNPDATDANSAAPPAANSTGATNTNPSIQPEPDPATSAAANPAATTNPPAGPAPSSAPSNSPDSSGTDSAATTSAAPATATPAATAAADTPAPHSAKSRKVAEAPPAKPPAAVKTTKPSDPVSEAQKYIYGRGAAQDCDRGMRLLKPAVNQSNPKAMVEMGALYSAGLCTPRDLPTAYRWFALALRKDPNNQSVQNDLQKLWGEMTQPERQLAIKLSQ